MDVRVVCSTRHDDETYHQFNLTRARHAEKAGRRFNTYAEKPFFSQQEFQRRLRGRSPRIDLQFDMDKPRDLPPGTPVVEVYRRPGT